MAVFADLDLRAGSDLKALRGLVENAAHLGYSVVAINHVVEFKEKKQEIEKPVAVSELFTTLPIVQGKSRPIKVLTRLTIIVSDPSHCNVLRATSSRVRLYDIVAVFPKTEKLFHVACTHLDVDLVCITVTEKLPFYFKRPPINVAIDRGVGFELIYSPAIKDSTMRRYTISNALNLMQVCKGKNVILSSAAERNAFRVLLETWKLKKIIKIPLEIRGPYDVANLGLLFGLSESDAKAAVSTNCRAVLLHGEHCRGLMELTLPKEAWEALPHHPLPPTQFGLWLVPDAGHYHLAFWPPQRD
ncbi:ribonuclease P protein subunit p30 isoform X1 [Mustela putorius furo]|uniref:Ribonuclease P protein subunit p30 n=1 Tax=Mustela putorius furo TaxID=9669 RepID=A0A8U0RH02_MUSPF|nr:ribonuclease P protein subunit p30 isoform X1 [Mustela putorius furo]